MNFNGRGSGIIKEISWRLRETVENHIQVRRSPGQLLTSGNFWIWGMST